MNTTATMIDWYNQSLEKYGEKDYRSLTWGDEQGTSAIRRYEDMNCIIPFADKRILEVGCGWGSFFDFGFICQKYTGIDINENFINIAKQRYSDHQFICMDINQYYSENQYDLVICSGVMGNQGGPGDHPEKLKNFITKIYHSLQANDILINFPSSWSTIRSNNIEYFSPSAVLEQTLMLTRNVTLYHKHKFDFLLHIHK